ncbi:phosphate butyryltransferase [Fictibacillus sp. KIGAM418]|uniref:Phosphate butyryltransferase n=1 Tax=Fictibacillus marinisediminis TaxID=2878389 RepID=A0A9X2BEF7_9BACL|nr:phosphate butyryltransferase [Fictibacillus marinisediminis]MCK6257635.1 phosphate butyryltransferase [Fictibacillus marinisediminis]
MKLEHLLNSISTESKKVVAVAAAEDEEVILSVKQAYEKGIASFILVGNKEKIQFLLQRSKLEQNEELQIMEAKPENAALEAVKVVSSGQADIVMKGLIPTADLLKAVLHKENGLRTGKILSHVAAFEVPGYDRLLFVTDSGMNIAPNLQQKAQIIENAVQVARGIGVEMPKVAVLAAVESVNTAMQATLDASALTVMNKRGQISGCIVDGPLALDNAISVKAAEHKGISGEVAGHADVLVVPAIETGNALYKSLIYFANAKVGAVIAGARAPIVLTSRADTAESKLYSIALAVKSLEKNNNNQEEK